MAEAPNFSNMAYGTSNTVSGDWLHRQVTPHMPVAAAVIQPAIGAMQQQMFNQLQQVRIKMATRLVRVFLADPNESLPLNKRVLFRGDEEWTELTDQELFFQLPVKELLDTHNTARITFDDKTTKSRAVVEKLEPARVRDLTMTVVTIVQF